MSEHQCCTTTVDPGEAKCSKHGLPLDRKKGGFWLCRHRRTVAHVEFTVAEALAVLTALAMESKVTWRLRPDEVAKVLKTLRSKVATTGQRASMHSFQLECVRTVIERLEVL